jgi:hypothetical protein
VINPLPKLLGRPVYLRVALVEVWGVEPQSRILQITPNYSNHCILLQMNHYTLRAVITRRHTQVLDNTGIEEYAELHR